MFCVAPQTDYLADEEMFNSWLDATLGDVLADQVRSEGLYTPDTASDGLYKGGNGSVWSTLQSDVLGDLALHCPARRAAGKLAAGAYLYSFEVTPYFTVNFPPDTWLGELGAFHGCETCSLAVFSFCSSDSISFWALLSFIK